MLLLAVALGACSGRVNEPSSKADNAAATFATLASAATAEAADPALKEAVGGEVRSTVLLEDVEVEPGDCKANNEPSEVLTVDKAWIVPGLGATFFVRRAGGARRVCDSIITPSGVDVCSAAPERFPEDPSRLEGSGGQLNFCAEGDDRVAFLSVQLPEGAAWAAIMTEKVGTSMKWANRR